MFGLKRNRKPDRDEGDLVVFLPIKPFEATYAPYPTSRGWTSPHTKDLRQISFGLAAFLIFAWVITYLLSDATSQISDSGMQLSVQSLVVLSLGGITGAVIALYEIGKRRFATVDLFSMEMLTVVRLFNITNFVGKTIRLYVPPTTHGDATEVDKREKINLSKAEASSGFLLSDHYSDIFVSNMKELGALESDVVDYVTAFYTFLKATREQTRVFFSNIDTDEYLTQETINAHVILTMYLVDTLISCGLRAINGLVQNPTHRHHAKRLAIAAAAPANNFLFRCLDARNGMYELTVQRRASYFEILRELDSEAKRLHIELRKLSEKS
ncbi:MAG: hypothetical protein GXP06_06390 [Alphaproteobacteria bacterium]|nr:hypothetical protein [Alphaproteobacteria bacterium]